MFFRVTEAFQVQQEKRCSLKLHKIDLRYSIDIFFYERAVGNALLVCVCFFLYAREIKVQQASLDLKD